MIRFEKYLQCGFLLQTKYIYIFDFSAYIVITSFDLEPSGSPVVKMQFALLPPHVTLQGKAIDNFTDSEVMTYVSSSISKHSFNS